ncbi:MAG: hypothetical protein M5R40_08150 [Anaerolineae bacterium]|nr:hypothetical protein [Anaerolineae bacterium]
MPMSRGGRGRAGTTPQQSRLPPASSSGVTGRDPDGAWLRAESGGQIVWLPVDAVESACDLASLPTYDADGPTVYGPMQAFYFVSGLGEVLCQEAPPSALVVQSPSGEHVTISANGVSVTLGSTVALQAAPNGAMRLVTLQGEATARAAGAQVHVPAGFQTTVPLGGADGLEPQGPPEPVDLADLSAFEALLQTPAALLTEVIAFPEPEAVEAFVAALCGDAVCQGFEDAASCPVDCASAVCNGVCDGTDCIDCPSDCRADQCYWCGNGTCDPIEDAASCPADCAGGGDGGDGGDDGDDGDNLARLCGDGVCQGHESAETCPVDCAGGGRLCGDGVCQGHESAETCPVDCGGGGRLCGDGVCQGHESAETCPADCD